MNNQENQVINQISSLKKMVSQLILLTSNITTSNKEMGNLIDGMTKKIDDLSTKIDNNTIEVTNLNTTCNGHGNTIANLNTTSTNHTNSINNLNTTILRSLQRKSNGGIFNLFKRNFGFGSKVTVLQPQMSSESQHLFDNEGNQRELKLQNHEQTSSRVLLTIQSGTDISEVKKNAQ